MYNNILEDISSSKLLGIKPRIENVILENILKYYFPIIDIPDNDKINVIYVNGKRVGYVSKDTWYYGFIEHKIRSFIISNNIFDETIKEYFEKYYPNIKPSYKQVIYDLPSVYNPIEVSNNMFRDLLNYFHPFCSKTDFEFDELFVELHSLFVMFEPNRDVDYSKYNYDSKNKLLVLNTRNIYTRTDESILKHLAKGYIFYRFGVDVDVIVYDL